jgi:integral membrane sensor domain MASE1
MIRFVLRTLLQAIVRALLTAVLYFAGARLGYAFALQAGFVTLWPPSGLMLGLLTLTPGQPLAAADHRRAARKSCL